MSRSPMANSSPFLTHRQTVDALSFNYVYSVVYRGQKSLMSLLK